MRLGRVRLRYRYFCIGSFCAHLPASDFKRHLGQKAIELRLAKAAAADAGDGDEAAQEAIGELKAQIADLMTALQDAQAGAAELMELRPKLAAFERQQADAMGASAPSPEEEIFRGLSFDS